MGICDGRVVIITGAARGLGREVIGLPHLMGKQGQIPVAADQVWPGNPPGKSR